MPQHILHTIDSAADAARANLAAVKETVGFLPNVYAVLGGTPNVLEAFVAMNAQFAASRLEPVEREIVQLAVSVQNACHYCVAGHTAFATALEMPAADIAALREDRPLANPRHEALRQFARTLTITRGHGADAAYDAFINAGYTAAQAQDVILGVSVKMFANTLAILFALPPDDSFKPYAWSPEVARHATAAA